MKNNINNFDLFSFSDSDEYINDLKSDNNFIDENNFNFENNYNEQNNLNLDSTFSYLSYEEKMEEDDFDKFFKENNDVDNELYKKNNLTQIDKIINEERKFLENPLLNNDEVNV